MIISRLMQLVIQNQTSQINDKQGVVPDLCIHISAGANVRLCTAYAAM